MRERIGHRGDQKTLPPAAQTPYIQLSGPDELLDHRTLAERASDYSARGEHFGLAPQPRLDPGHPLDILGERSGGDLHYFEIFRRNQDVRCASAVHELEVAFAIFTLDP